MIKDLSDLKKLFKLCRQQGIDELKLHGVEIKFGLQPEAQRSHQGELPESIDELDEETLMYWSSDKGQEALDEKVGLSKKANPQ